MAFVIEGATGNKALVTDEGMLTTRCVTVSAEHHTNHTEEEAYHIQFGSTLGVTADDDCVFYMTNTSDKDMICEGVDMFINAASQVYLKVGDKGTRNSATAVTPTNCNAGSGKAADGTFEWGVDLDGGAAGLTGGTEVQRWVFIAQTASEYKNFDMDIIVPKNETFTIWMDTSGVSIMCTIPVYFHESI
ncbi:unnamed protein product [marine sediment metagenome]|uniref:Uncharacterized protein n=1 Tax=marine sediment metagenome TaxID=412755 RepID=X0TE12_9ZZZZ